ncbi:hypothetical protein [Clavibacter capsici]|uniref:hypothetical protein n=1 Tax=Clavibacter capsici TaxID=1874630 RepID=UPI0006B20B1E|nr:hypothetical protein [Clavibacter capsici]ALD13130.1 hypothetical protein AES38_09540 [Clavibacter capsici]
MTQDQGADRAEARAGDGNPVTRRKALLRNYAIATGMLRDNIPSLHSPIYRYVQALQDEAAYYRVESRQLRAQVAEMTAQREEVRGG